MIGILPKFRCHFFLVHQFSKLCSFIDLKWARDHFVKVMGVHISNKKSRMGNDLVLFDYRVLDKKNLQQFFLLR